MYRGGHGGSLSLSWVYEGFMKGCVGAAGSEMRTLERKLLPFSLRPHEGYKRGGVCKRHVYNKDNGSKTVLARRHN